MWEPEPGWRRLPGSGPSSGGVWLADRDGRDAVVKRLVCPSPHDPPEYADPEHPAYWRRAADVALAGTVRETPGLREPEVLGVEEDEEGITLVHARVVAVDNPGLFLARAIGRFAGAVLPPAPWLASGQLARRLAAVERRGGWTTLARTPVADLADSLWSRRASFVARVSGLPQVPQHGDPVPGNLPGRSGDDVVAVDWAALGLGPVGADLGYLALSTREAFEPLLTAYLEALPDGLAAADDVALAARVTSVFTVLTRADWALARVAPGEGALAGKFRHPSVAPYLRAMQRQLPQVEALVAPRTAS